MTTDLHEERLAAVIAAVRESGAQTVLDLGCGDGDLVQRLAEVAGIDRITGIEIDAARLRRAQARLAEGPAVRTRVQLACASASQFHAQADGL